MTGVMQVGSAILMLPRRTLTAGAAMLAASMAGAAFVDLFILPSPIVSVPLLLLMIYAAQRTALHGLPAVARSKSAWPVPHAYPFRSCNAGSVC
jgi:hypothetical protein